MFEWVWFERGDKKPKEKNVEEERTDGLWTTD